MDSNTDSDDKITRAILSGSTYQRLKYERHSFFRQSVTRTLTLQSALLGLLAILLPVYGLFPESVAGFLPATDPAVASPKVVLLGMVGGGLQLLGAGLLVGSVVYRVRRGPLTEAQAHTAIDVEDFARYVGLGTGGLAILLTVCLFALGLGGSAAVGGYIDVAGANPFAPSGFDISVASVSLTAFAGSVAVFYASSYLSVQLSLLQARRRSE